MLSNTIFEGAVDQILDVAQRFSWALETAGVSGRVIGGMAVFMHVEQCDPMSARLTRDVDVAIERRDLERISAAVAPFGFHYRQVAGVDMFLTGDQKARSAVHIVFVGEKVRPEYVEPIPGSEPVLSNRGILIAPVSDLVHMKLTSFRLKDRVHIQDMDGVGLITPEIEADLSPFLRDRLAEIRATE